jgi:chemotaxis protein MotB
MKKTLVVIFMIFAFVLGLSLSDYILSFINTITNKNLFRTCSIVEKELAISIAEMDELRTKNMLEEEQLRKLIDEIANRDMKGLSSAFLMTQTLGENVSDEQGDIGIIEKSGLLIDLNSQDFEMTNHIKQTYNSAIANVIIAASTILKDKVSALNNELIQINLQLNEKNVSLQENILALERKQKEMDELKGSNEELKKLENDLRSVVKGLEIKIENNRLTVTFKGDILYESGKHKLTDEGLSLLESIVPYLKEKENGYDIYVAGHTDNVPIKFESKKKYENNWGLSTFRSIEVSNYLMLKGLKASNLAIAGYGEFRPVESNETEAGRAKNRRVELYLVPKIIKRENGN